MYPWGPDEERLHIQKKDTGQRRHRFIMAQRSVGLLNSLKLVKLNFTIFKKQIS